MNYLTIFVLGIIVGLILYRFLFPYFSKNKKIGPMAHENIKGIELKKEITTNSNFATKDDLDAIKKDLEDFKSSYKNNNDFTVADDEFYNNN